MAPTKTKEKDKTLLPIQASSTPDPNVQPAPASPQQSPTLSQIVSSPPTSSSLSQQSTTSIPANLQEKESLVPPPSETNRDILLSSNNLSLKHGTTHRGTETANHLISSKNRAIIEQKSSSFSSAGSPKACLERSSPLLQLV